MDWEVPVDAWYVWLALSVVSIAVAGVVLGFPTGPPPDSNRAANAIERTTGGHDVSASYDHDADVVKIDGATVSMRNGHGTTHASLAYGQIVPVMGHERLENVAHGASIESEYGDESDSEGAFLADLVDAHDATAGEWKTADGVLAARTLAVEADAGPTVSVDGSASAAGDDSRNLESTAASELTVRYTAASGTDVKLVYAGDEFAAHGHDPNSRIGTTRVTGTGSREHTEIDLLPDDSSSFGQALVYPIAVEVHVDGTAACEGELTGDRGFEPICDGGALAGDVAGDVDRIADRSEAGEYRVTLVTA